MSHLGNANAHHPQGLLPTTVPGKDRGLLCLEGKRGSLRGIVLGSGRPLLRVPKGVSGVALDRSGHPD